MPLQVPEREVQLQAANVGQAISQVAPVDPSGATDGLALIALAQQKQRNADRVFRAEASLSDKWREFEAGALQRTGVKAWGLTQEAENWFEENTGTVMSELENDAQRVLFEQSAAGLRERGLNALSRFEAQEQRASFNEAATHAITATIDSAASSYDNPELVDQARVDVADRVGVLANINGWTPERTRAERATQLTELHRQVLQNMVEHDPDGAIEYYGQYKEEIVGSERENIEELVRLGGVRRQAQERTDAIMSSDLSEEAALAEARSIENAELRDAVVQRVQNRFTEREQVKTQAQREAADEAWNIFSLTKDIAQIPTATWLALDGKTRLAIEAETRKPPTTDWNQYYALLDESTQNPAAFAERDLRETASFLAPEQRRVLETAQDRINSDSYDSGATVVQMLGRTYRDLGYGNSDRDNERKAALEYEVRRAITLEQQKLKRELNEEEINTIISRQTIRQEGSIWNALPFVNQKRFFELTPEEKESFRADIPESYREELRQRFMEYHGREPVNEDEVIANWLNDGSPNE